MSKVKVNAIIGADIREFISKMQQVSKEMDTMGKNIRAVGAVMTAAVTAPFLAFATVSLRNWDKQAKAVAAVENAIRATGGAARLTSVELQAMASDLQKNSLFGDEDLLQNITATMLTFPTITGEVFGRAQQAVLDLAVAMQMDLKGAAVQLSKALADPEKGLTALAKGGTSFTETQREMILGMWDAGDTAGAQVEILKVLEEQYKGAAKAAAEAGTGGLAQLKNAIGDLFEPFGELIYKFIQPIIKRIHTLVDRINSWSQSKRALILTITGLLAAVGPLMLVIGQFMIWLPKIIAGLRAMAVAGALVSLKLLIIVGAIALLIASFVWIKVNAVAIIERAQVGFIKLKNSIIGVMQTVLIGMASILRAPDSILRFFGIKADSSGYLLKQVERLQRMREEVYKVTTDFKSLGSIIKDTFAQVTPATDSLVPIELTEDSSSEGGGVRKRGGLIGVMQGKGMPASFGGLTDQLGKIPEVLDQVKTAFTELPRYVDETMNELNSILESFIEGGLIYFSEKLGEAFATGGFKNGELGKGLLEMTGRFMQQLGGLMVTTGIGIEAFKSGLATVNPALVVAGGMALIAAGSAVTSFARNGFGGNVTGGASASGQTASGGDITVTGIIRGGDLYLINQDYQRRRK